MLGQWTFGIYGTHLRWEWWLEGVIWVVEDVIVGWRWQRWLIRNLVVQWSFASLLAEDFKVVLHLCEPHSLSTDVLSVSFGMLHCGLTS
jgi:hypothetical protein